MSSAAAYPLSDAPLEEGDCPWDLVERLRQGDPTAVAEVYDAHHAAVRAFAHRLVGDDHAAEDLVHDVFVALPRVIQRYARRSSLKTFLIGVAINHARHHVRAAARRRKTQDRLAEQTVPPSSPNPERNIERAQLARALQRALDRLPLGQRVVFTLCELEDHTSVEVAQILDLPEGTVRSRLFHAKKRLRDWLTKEGLR
ncbi:MAG: RNA polymerase sigma factor [Myxococcales bacterium]|nr:RNA polymerase sigma factor [Myxococcales bacterium]